jgi:hypothetical protein
VLALRAASPNNFAPQALLQLSVGTASTVEMYTRTTHYVAYTSTPIAQLVFCMPNAALVPNAGYKNCGSVLTILDAVAVVGSTIVQLTFSGSSTIAIADGATCLSDAISASAFSQSSFAAGSTVEFRVRYSLPGNNLFIPHCGGSRLAANQGYYVDPTKVNFTNGIHATGAFAYSMINGGVNGTDAKSAFTYPQPLMLGYHNDVTPIFIGDSKTAGTGDTVTSFGAGGMTRTLFPNPAAITNVKPGINFGCPSGNAVDVATSAGAPLANLYALWAYGTHAIVGYGTNAPQPATYSNFTTMYSKIRAAGITKIVQRSMTPKAASANISVVQLTSSGTACTAQIADSSGITGGASYPVAGASPAAYNGTFAMTVADSTHLTYTAGSAPGSSPATGTITINDQYRTTQYQVLDSNYGVGSNAASLESLLIGGVSSDANLSYYNSLGERSATSGAGYWKWKANGTVNLETADGTHETAAGYEDNITTGNYTTQGGGTVAGSLRTIVQGLN